jgi:hypothetical protein
MKRLISIVFVLVAGCGDTTTNQGEAPDAGVDCCALYPDEVAVRACAEPMLPANACVTLVCHADDGSNVRVAACGARVDGGAQ